MKDLLQRIERLERLVLKPANGQARARRPAADCWKYVPFKTESIRLHHQVTREVLRMFVNLSADKVLCKDVVAFLLDGPVIGYHKVRRQRNVGDGSIQELREFMIAAGTPHDLLLVLETGNKDLLREA